MLLQEVESPVNIPAAVLESKYNFLFISESVTDALAIATSENILFNAITFTLLKKMPALIMAAPDVIVVNIPEGSAVSADEVLPLLSRFTASRIFICGRKQDKTSLYAMNRNLFFWEGEAGHLKGETILQLVRLKETKVKLQREYELLTERIERQAIMMSELEQTNSNLISATWRERDLKKILANTLSELEKSKNVIEKQNRKISESINYSRRIQNVILPDEAIIKRDLPESFILYMPKDVVSGDFPFYFKEGNTIYLAAVDCTGHGVPGAMLSLIGNLSLNDILSLSGAKTPGTVLQRLHAGIVKILKQDIAGNDASDGMDIGLCALDLESGKLEFAGAHRPLFHIRNGELREYKGARLPIGGKQYRKEIIYKDHEIEICPGDTFFLFSDGFPDQFGGPGKEKYGPLRIQEYLLANRHLSMEELKEGLRGEFINWKGSEKQMDDILFIGFKL